MGMGLYLEYLVLEKVLCTGITQNVVDLLQNYTATTMLANSEFVVLLKQANTDSSKMAEVVGVSTKGARAKAKANASQGIPAMVEIATEKVFRENHKEKHDGDAENGWYYYTTRFALPVYDNETKTGNYNVYSGCLVINCPSNGKMYLYDLVDIKKEASNPLKTNK